MNVQKNPRMNATQMQTALTLQDHISANADAVFMEMEKVVQVLEVSNFFRLITINADRRVG